MIYLYHKTLGSCEKEWRNFLYTNRERSPRQKQTKKQGAEWYVKYATFVNKWR